MNQNLKFSFQRENNISEVLENRWKMCAWKPTIKRGGGSIMIWGYLTANGAGDLVWIDGIINAEKYRQILIHLVILSVKRLIGNSFIFQQDNDPKHTALKVKSYFQQKE